MEQKGSILNWKLSVAETISFGVTLTVFVYFVTTNFVSKDEGSKIEHRIENLENKFSNMNDNINGIAKSVEYIKGRLEPKNKGE